MINSNKKAYVDWYAYAEKYDMLLAYNPFYQELQQRVFQNLKSWNVSADNILADLGAGTGNYSVEIARIFPTAQVFHIDNNKEMNAIAAKKAANLSNFTIQNLHINDVQFEPESLHGLICINAIYTFPNPTQILRKMYQWLAPEAKAILVDPGRVMNMFSWKMAISWHLLKNHGWKKTMEIFKEAKAVSEQNTYIREMQKNGTYWTHSHEEFCDAVLKAGFRIHTSEICFRGDCDLVIAHKN